MVIVRLCLFLSALTLSAGCASSGPGYRSLHEVDGEVVYSPPVASGAYAAYLRARLALEASPPRLDEAQRSIEHALRFDPRDPHLWTTRARIAALAGDTDGAVESATRALTLRPGYPPAQSVMAELDRGGANRVEHAKR